MRSCEVRCGGVELEVEVREFVAPAAFTSALVSLFGVRTDTMLGHVDWVDLLHLNIEQNVLTRKLVSVRTREGPARSWRARGGSTLSFPMCVRSEVTALHVCT